MTSQERYWTANVLREVLKRVELLNNEDPPEALKAGQAALCLLERVRDPSPNLRALTLAVHGSTLRYAGQLDEALRTYEQALRTDGLGTRGRSDVLVRMAVTQVYLGQITTALDTVGTALTLTPSSSTVRVVQGWVRMLAGLLTEALDDCMYVLEALKTSPQRADVTLLSAIVNSCNILSYRAGLNVDPAIVSPRPAPPSATP